MSLNNIFVRTFRKTDLLGAPQMWDEVDLTKKNATTRKGKAEWTMAKEATIYGFAIWWDCELLKGIKLSTAPGAPKTHWEQLYFPVLEPIKLKKGAKLGREIIATSSYEAGTNMRWTVTANGKKQVLDSEKGFIARAAVACCCTGFFARNGVCGVLSAFCARMAIAYWMWTTSQRNTRTENLSSRSARR